MRRRAVNGPAFLGPALGLLMVSSNGWAQVNPAPQAEAPAADGSSPSTSQGQPATAGEPQPAAGTAAPPPSDASQPTRPPPSAAIAPGPAPGETIPPIPEAAANTAPDEEPEPPKAYLLPPPPIGAHYPGPAAVAGDGRADTGELRLPSRISTRLRVLATDLDALANRGGPSLTNGVLSIVTGGLSIALGALLDEESLTNFLYVFGSTSVARGVVDLAFAPDPDAVALEFSHMPMRDVEEVKVRLRFGEQGLRGLADDSRIARLLDGGLSVAGGLAVVPMVLLPLAEDDEREIEALDVFVIIGAGISILSGVISLVSASEAERRDEAYTKLKQRLRKPPTEAPTEAAQISISVSSDTATLWLVQRF